MVSRKIIEIDRDLCNGCGLCTTACAEGALELDSENKAVIVRELYCDGMGACLDVCATGALTIVERESEGYDARETAEHIRKTRGEDAVKNVHGYGHHDDHHKHHGHHHDHHAKSDTIACGCQGSHARTIERPVQPSAAPTTTAAGPTTSELSQWPIQLQLVSPAAPYFNECDLLIAADCTAFACGGFHQSFLKDKRLVIACPKLDETGSYIEKIAEIIRHNTIFSVTVVIMTVPCCSSLARIVQEAVALSGKAIAVKKIVVGLDGEIQS
jgi:ferredoxin